MAKATSYDHLTVNMTQAKKLVVTALKADQRVMLWGAPGVGKTDLARQVGAVKALGFESVIVITPSTDDVIDFKLPHIVRVEVNGEEEYVSSFALSDRLPRSGKHLILIDEINTAPTSLQPTLYGLVQKLSIGTWTAPKGTAVIATGNRETDRAAAQPMPSALRNRFAIHMNILPDTDSWTQWGASNGIRPELLAYVRQFPDALQHFDADDPCGGCTPRGLANLSALMTAGIPDDCAHVAYQGAIGQGRGTELMGFLDLFKANVFTDDIIKNPMKANVPGQENAAVAYAISAALAAVADKKNIAAIAKYVARLDPSHQVCFWMDATRRSDDLKNCKEYAEHCHREQDVLF